MLCVMWWRKKKKKKGKIGRGPIERCVGKFRLVPRGGVKKNKKKEEFFGRGPFGQQVLDFVLCRFVPRGGGRMEGDEKKKRKKKKPTYVGLMVRKNKFLKLTN